MKAELLRALQTARSTMLSKLDDLSEFDQRRPLTPTGTNLLGLVKHLAGLEYGYSAPLGGGRSVGEDQAFWHERWSAVQAAADFFRG